MHCYRQLALASTSQVPNPALSQLTRALPKAMFQTSAAQSSWMPATSLGSEGRHQGAPGSESFRGWGSAAARKASVPIPGGLRCLWARLLCLPAALGHHCPARGELRALPQALSPARKQQNPNNSPARCHSLDGPWQAQPGRAGCALSSLSVTGGLFGGLACPDFTGEIHRAAAPGATARRKRLSLPYKASGPARHA